MLSKSTHTAISILPLFLILQTQRNITSSALSTTAHDFPVNREKSEAENSQKLQFCLSSLEIPFALGSYDALP